MSAGVRSRFAGKVIAELREMAEGRGGVISEVFDIPAALW
jgi:hypothetical protein